MGLLDGLFSDDPKQQALIQMAFGLLGGAPGQRKNFGADIANAGLLGVQGYNQGRVLQSRQQEADQAKQLRDIQLRTATRNEQDTQGIADFLRNRMGQPQEPQQLSGPGMPSQVPQQVPQMPSQAPQMPGAPQLLPGGKAPTVGASAPTKANLFQQFSDLASGLEGLGTPAALERAKVYRDMAEKARPEVKETKTLMQDGKRVTVNIFKDGTFEVAPFAPDQEKLHFADQGGVIQGVDPLTGNPVGQSLKKSVSPDTVYTGGVTMRGQNMTSATTRRGQDLNNRQVVETPNGPIVVDKPTSTSTPVTSGGKPVPGEAQMKRESGAKTVLGLLDEAEKHIGGATNSFVGAGADLAARGVGYGTEGAKSIAALKTIEGSLLAQMPRMEGPQSNYDVAMYKQAAGSLGDPTVPREIKMAGLAAIRTIQQRYADNSMGANAAKGSVRRYNPATGRIE